MKTLADAAGNPLGVANQPRMPGSSPALVSETTFRLYIYFIVDFFLHFSARVPAYGKIRPTLLLVVIIAVMLWAQQGKLKARGTSPLFRALLILAAYVVISLPFVQYPGSVIRGNLAPFIKAISFFYFTALIIDSPKRLKIFLFVYVATQVFRVMEPLMMHFTSGYWGSSTYLGGGEFADRLAGSPSDVVNPNGLGFVIATVIPYLHYLLFPRGILGKALYIALLPMGLYALILTMSRGAFIALVVVIIMIVKDAKYRALYIAVIFGLLVGSWSVMTPFQQDRYLSLIGKSDTENARTEQGRIDGMITEFKIGFTRPIVGHGLGTSAETKFHMLGDSHVSHNLYAELMIEIGMIGAAIFLYFLYSVYQSLSSLRAFLRRRRGGPGSFVSRLEKALTTVFFMYIVYSINYWGLSQYYWYLFGGVVFAFHRLVKVYSTQVPVVKGDHRDLSRD